MKVLGVQRDSNLIFLNFTQTPLPIGGQIWWVLYLVEGMGRMYIRMLSCIVHTSIEACLLRASLLQRFYDGASTTVLLATVST